MGLIQEVELRLDAASKARLVSQMGAAGKESGQKLEREMGGSFDGIKAMATKVGAAIVAAFAIQRVVAWGKALVMASIEADASWSRLDQTLRGVGVRLSDVRNEVDKVIDGLKNTRFDNDALAESLGSLVQMTGDYNKSLTLVSVAADLAAARHLDLQTATMLVGRAANGSTELLQRYGIFVQKGADATEALREQFRGFAEREGKENIGQVAILANSWDDAREAMGGFLIEAGDGVSVLGRLTETVRGLATALNIYAVSVKHVTEIALGETEAEITKHRNLIMFLGKVPGLKGGAGRLAELGAINPNAPGEMAGLSRVEAEYVRLLAVQKELTREVNDAARAQAAATASAHDAAEEAARKAALLRASEANTEASLKRQKEAQEAWDRAAPVWAERREQGQLARSPMDTSWSKGGPKMASEFAWTGPQPEVLAIGIGENVSAALQELAANPPGNMLTGWDSLWGSLFHSGQNIALAITDAWSGAFSMMMEDGLTLANFFEGLGTSIARSMAQGVAQFAQTKVGEQIAKAIEEGAEAWGHFASGNVPSGVMALKSAAGHVAAAAAWGALAGAGNTAGRMGSTSAGGLGSGYRTGANTRDSLESERRGATINIRIDGIDPSNPRHGDLVIATMGAAVERYGGEVFVNGRRS